MVYVNHKKYACEACINGHRSSSCSHSLRPLFEVKGKGRPSSQCESCQDLRKNKRRHVKCSCATKSSPFVSSQIDPLLPMPKSNKRLKTNIPSLPNGIRDILKATSNDPSSSSEAPSVKQQVGFLLNPCSCDVRAICSCGARQLSVSDDGGSPPMYGSRPLPDHPISRSSSMESTSIDDTSCGCGPSYHYSGCLIHKSPASIRSDMTRLSGNHVARSPYSGDRIYDNHESRPPLPLQAGLPSFYDLMNMENSTR